MPAMSKYHVKTLVLGKKKRILVSYDRMVLSLAEKTGMRSLIISAEDADGGKYMEKDPSPSWREW